MLGILGYLDPGTNSFLLQLLLGGSAGLVILFRMGWDAVRSRLSLTRRPR
jgi:hypothetical protein